MLTIEQIIRYGDGDMVFTTCSARYGNNILCFIARDADHARGIVECLQGSDTEYIEVYFSITSSPWFPFAEGETCKLAMERFIDKLSTLSDDLAQLQQQLSQHATAVRLFDV